MVKLTCSTSEHNLFSRNRGVTLNVILDISILYYMYIEQSSDVRHTWQLTERNKENFA